MVSLAKGSSVSLAKDDGSKLGKVTMGLGWDVRKSKGLFGMGGGSSGDIDLDASAIMFDSSKNVVDIVYFGAKQSKDGSIFHTGDNVTGAGDGDDEQIRVDLNAVAHNVQSIVFTVNSFRGDTFDKIENAKCRLLDEREAEFATFDLSDSGPHTALIMAKVAREGGGWKMTAIGEKANGKTAQQIASVAAPHA